MESTRSSSCEQIATMGWILSLPMALFVSLISWNEQASYNASDRWRDHAWPLIKSRKSWVTKIEVEGLMWLISKTWGTSDLFYSLEKGWHGECHVCGRVFKPNPVVDPIQGSDHQISPIFFINQNNIILVLKNK
jgi:hypothetical protein